MAGVFLKALWHLGGENGESKGIPTESFVARLCSPLQETRQRIHSNHILSTFRSDQFIQSQSVSCSSLDISFLGGLCPYCLKFYCCLFLLSFAVLLGAPRVIWLVLLGRALPLWYFRGPLLELHSGYAASYGTTPTSLPCSTLPWPLWHDTARGQPCLLGNAQAMRIPVLQEVVWFRSQFLFAYMLLWVSPAHTDTLHFCCKNWVVSNPSVRTLGRTLCSSSWWESPESLGLLYLWHSLNTCYQPIQWMSRGLSASSSKEPLGSFSLYFCPQRLTQQTLETATALFF